MIDEEKNENHPVDELLVELVTQHPRSQADLQHASPLSAFGTIYRLMKLVESGRLKVSRTAPSTIYSISPTKEEKGKESDGQTPLKNDLQTVNGGNDARIRN